MHMCVFEMLNNLSVGDHLLAWPTRALNLSKYALTYVSLNDSSIPNLLASLPEEFTWAIHVFYCLAGRKIINDLT